MSRYSNSYPQDEALQTMADQTTKADSQPMRARPSVAYELSLHVEVTQELHEQIDALSAQLTPLLSPEQSGVTSAKMLEGPPCSDLVNRAGAHTRSLREAVDRLLDLRDRIEL